MHSTNTNQYRITIEQISSKQSDNKTNNLVIELADREDMFNLVEKMKQGSELAAEDATKLVLAIRLLGPLMIANRKHHLFTEFMPSFKQFMANLKKQVKAKLAAKN